MQKLLVISGPTGTGKTDLGIKLANKFNGEIVSADSRQVYIGMDIGTGKGRKPKEGWKVDGVPIHLYDIKKPDEKFSLAEYQQLALEIINNIHSRGKLPILVGGTGLYIQAVTEGLKIPKSPPDQKLRNKLENRELSDLLQELEEVDPEYYEKVDQNNKRRVVRALEVFYQTGEAFSKQRAKYKVPFDIFKIGLTSDREELYARNDKRVEEWFENGFVQEVRDLLTEYSENLPSMTSLGYRQVAAYIKGNLGSDEAVQRIKFEYHGYIRRQLTWFRRDNSIYWFDIVDEHLFAEVEDIIYGWLKAY